MVISRFPVASLEGAPADIRERLSLVQSKTGFVPNVFLALLHRPDEWRAFVAYHDAGMERPSGLTKGGGGGIVVATTAARGCPYCVIAPRAVLRLRPQDPPLPALLAPH